MIPDHTSPSAPIMLQTITRKDLPAILELEVSRDQLEHYPRSNAHSIAQASFAEDSGEHDASALADELTRSPELIETLSFAPDAWFRSIYADQTPIGFVMLSLVPEKAEYFVWRIMIDQRYQGNGYGSRAMEAVIEFVKTLPDARILYLSHMQGNEGMARFCQKLGFRYTGEEIVPGDLMMKLDLGKHL